MKSIATYDPRRLNDDDFLANFVARGELTEFLFAQLLAMGPEGKHRLFIGQRGMGKTSLLIRLALGIERDPELLRRYMPLTFREEQYNVRTIDQFWRNCGEALAEWMEKSGDPARAAEVDRQLLEPEWREGDAAAAAFLALCEKAGKRPVLLVDNFDLILAALPPDQHWQLRGVLQQRGGPILFGASIYFPAQSSDRDAAFYEFFQFHHLDTLTVAELTQCLRALVKTRGEKGIRVEAVLNHEPARLKVLHTLTGGNPRMVTLLYKLLEMGEGNNAFEDLEVLLEELTPYYKARVEELSGTPRAVFDGVALNWDPVLSHDLAGITGIEITTLSSQLNRLQNIGLIESVPTSGARAGYQITERFFNIWYLMRHGTRRLRAKMKWLTAFLQSFYSMEELRGIFGRAGRDGLHPYYVEAFRAALGAGEDGDWADSPFQQQYDELHDLPDDDPQVLEFLALAEREDPFDPAYWMLLGLHMFLRRHRLGEAEAAFRKAIQIDPNFVWPLVYLGEVISFNLDRADESESIFRQALQLDPNNPAIWNSLGRLISFDPQRYAEAEICLQQAINFEPELTWSWQFLGDLLARDPNRTSDAITAFRQATEIDQNMSDAWNQLGQLLFATGGSLDEAEIALRRSLFTGAQAKFAPQSTLFWIYMETGRKAEAIALLSEIGLDETNFHRCAKAALDLIDDNFGSNVKRLQTTFAAIDNQNSVMAVINLLHFTAKHGYAERLINWFETSGHRESDAPWYHGVLAYIRGERFLRDINPEIRAPALEVYTALTRRRPETESQTPKRGRPKKRR